MTEAQAEEVVKQACANGRERRPWDQIPHHERMLAMIGSLNTVQALTDLGYRVHPPEEEIHADSIEWGDEDVEAIARSACRLGGQLDFDAVEVRMRLQVKMGTHALLQGMKELGYQVVSPLRSVKGAGGSSGK